jgi:hypothetical protein
MMMTISYKTTSETTPAHSTHSFCHWLVPGCNCNVLLYTSSLNFATAFVLPVQAVPAVPALFAVEMLLHECQHCWSAACWLPGVLPVLAVPEEVPTSQALAEQTIVVLMLLCEKESWQRGSGLTGALGPLAQHW